jgi:hypothetical protein
MALRINESLVKYLAGLLDADGSLSFNFRRVRDHHTEDRYFIGLMLRLASSEAVDKNGFIRTLPALCGMGTVVSRGEKAACFDWSVADRADLEMLLPRLIKHMVLKARHWQWMLDTWRMARANGKTCTPEERERLTLTAKESRRRNVGPLKPKNHPTWAWLAGYLDGDGYYSYRHRIQNGYENWNISVSACAHVNDIVVLEFLQRSFGGLIVPQGQSDSVKIWKRPLGCSNRSFALQFLPKLARHSRLKRHKIDAIIHHHRQRLSVPGPKRASDSLSA